MEVVCFGKNELMFLPLFVEKSTKSKGLGANTKEELLFLSE